MPINLVSVLVSMVLGGTSLPISVVQPVDPLKTWLDKLEICESGGNHEAVGDSGLAASVLQFHKPTFVRYAKIYMDKLFPEAEDVELENFYKDADSQRKLAYLMVSENPQNWKHWTNCTKKIGLPPRGTW